MGRALGCLVIVASLAFAAPARAADPPSTATTPDEARAEAQKRLDEGLQRYARGDYEGARVAFAQAYAVLSSIDLLYNLSRAEVRSGHPLEAIVHLRQILRDPSASSDDRAKAKKLLDDANAQTGHVAVQAPDGAEVVIDAVPSGECPLREPLDVAPGKHVVEARVRGTVHRVEIVASSGSVVTARFDVEPSAPAAAPTPATPPPIARAEDHDRDRPASSSSARTVVPLVLGGAALVALGVGAVMGLASKSHESDASDFRATHAEGFCADRATDACAQYQGILDSQQQATTIERVALVAGGVLAVSAVATWAFWPRPRGKETSAWIAPTLGGVRAGMTF